MDLDLIGLTLRRSAEVESLAVFQRTDSAGARSFLPDALGSTLALADSTGTVQTQYTYEPFGNTTLTGSATTNSFAYTGRELDAIGLYFYRARYYSPTLQRFLSEDPAGLKGGLNPSLYVGNSPTGFIDSLGLSPVCVWAGTVDFWTSTTYENPSPQPDWLFLQFYSKGPSRGPFSGPASPPPGVLPIGIPWVVGDCLWQRTVIYQVWETTWLLNMEVCVEHDCKGIRPWPHFAFSSSRHFVRNEGRPDRETKPLLSNVAEQVTDSVLCIANGPP